METIEHIFVECYTVRKMWKNLKVLHSINQIENTQGSDWLNIIKTLQVLLNTKYISWKEGFPFFLWNIWLKRNENYHQNTKTNICTKKNLNQAIEFYTLTGNTCLKEKSIKTLIRWIPPIQGYKLNTDGSSIRNPGKSGIGGVIRDTKGEWIVGFVGILHLANNIKHHKK
ncbi:hypothetical protein AABB24_015729 [Solanum stoloniferum]|uniref:RNase H type-1 domain-containing protein n=1 Tax=Solanum stoloniferum TaxID=62892 RepID=A0ABD2TQU1_9SOLN